MVVLGIGDCRGEYLADILSHGLLGELQHIHRIFHAAATNKACHKVQLLRRALDHRTDGQCFILFDAAGVLNLSHQRLPFLSAP